MFKSYPSYIDDILPPDIEAECRDDVMKLRVAFNDTFAGLIYSAGMRLLGLYRYRRCNIERVRCQH